MKENLNIQFVYPNYKLPKEYLAAIDSIDHIDIYPAEMADNADVVVFDSLVAAKDYAFKEEVAYLIRTDKVSLFNEYKIIGEILDKVTRLNVVITDIETFTEDDFMVYKSLLSNLAERVEQIYVSGKSPQLNLLTDRIMLEKMNNCGAGDTSVTLAPDGKFYVCPAFYLSADGYTIGDLASGLEIKNSQLYRLDHAPLCRRCDAWQCKRCIWLNRKTTLEVNTPSHEQCVVAHLERNASRKLLIDIRKYGKFMPGSEEIKEIDYLDPFDVKEEW
ncbi:CXXX repeat peptide maturase [Leyella stercorea]|uniref:CXXX repeat peptide maturase n=1 Tax=Leyella stercorea TaxID=363265 RepID=UPI00242B8440|nr:CXXX repeat peptide maturase [Leyella stercorea]